MASVLLPLFHFTQRDTVCLTFLHNLRVQLFKCAFRQKSDCLQNYAMSPLRRSKQHAWKTLLAAPYLSVTGYESRRFVFFLLLLRVGDPAECYHCGAAVEISCFCFTPSGLSPQVAREGKQTSQVASSALTGERKPVYFPCQGIICPLTRRFRQMFKKKKMEAPGLCVSCLREKERERVCVQIVMCLFIFLYVWHGSNKTPLAGCDWLPQHQQAKCK